MDLVLVIMRPKYPIISLRYRNLCITINIYLEGKNEMTREETRDEIKRYLETLYNLKNDLFVVQHRLQTIDTDDCILYGHIYASIDYANECFSKAITSLESQLRISRSLWKYFWWYRIADVETEFIFKLIDIWVINAIHIANNVIHDILQDCENDQSLINQMINDVSKLQDSLTKFMEAAHLIGRKWV